MYPHGIFRVTAAAPRTAVANPRANVDASIAAIRAAADSDLIVLPELGITGYTCGDLFATESLIRDAVVGLGRLADDSRGHDAILVAGLPLSVQGSLMNVAAIVAGGRVVGVVPKSYLPTYREFYEGRHFRAGGSADPDSVTLFGETVPFGTDLLFRRGEAVIGVELCEDFWTPIPPSSLAAVAGANVLVNLSASNETIGKAAWRRDLIRSQSGRCLAAYAFSSSGPGESTSDIVYGGQCVIAESGQILAESRRVGDGREPLIPEQTAVTRDVDLQRLAHDRRVISSFDDVRDRMRIEFREIAIDAASGPVCERREKQTLRRRVDGQPFVPGDPAERETRCAEILAIQTAGFAKRITRIPESEPLVIGVSGGLDSTLALLVAVATCDAVGQPRSRIHAITMPGFGTTDRTRDNADALIGAMGVIRESIDIRQLCLDTFRSLGHRPLGVAIDGSTDVETLQQRLIKTHDDAKDLVFENVQARLRTFLLMSRGFVIGTGDLSEQALGWSTYNADHMSMYNVNTSVPKTLVRFLVRYAADHRFEGNVRDVLYRIADTPISPELLPPAKDGTIRQDTEASVGAYELHDFFLYHFVRHGCSRDKILYLARHATFSEAHTAETIEATLERFFRRFFANQFKRNCVPDGPKVGSVSLSPRGDWRMPSDGDADSFLR